MEAARNGDGTAQRRQAGARNTAVVCTGGASDNPEDCPVCLTGYDDTVQRPCTLPCGHTVCTLCIDKLKDQGHVTCPECHFSHTMPEGGQFPISYALEAIIRRLRHTEVAASAALLPPTARKGKGATGKMQAAGLSKKMRSFIKEQEATVVAAITACQEVQSQLSQYQTTLTGWVERQQQLEDRLQGLVDQSRTVRELVQQEKSRVVAKEEEVKKGEQELQAVLETLHTLTTDQEAGIAVTEVFRCTGKAEHLVGECQECFPDASTVTTIITVRKVREASCAALEAAQAVRAALEAHPIVTTEELRPQSDPDSTIIDRLQPILSLNLKGPLEIKDLHSLTQPTRNLLQAGQVFAVHQVEGQRQHAKISCEDQLYFHALKMQPLPCSAATLQVSQVVLPSPPCMVFLDLSWPGSRPRRVKICLSPDTPRGRQFLLLCTGQRSHSYVNTRFLGVGSKGQPGEFVGCGDYESNDGKGASVLLPDLDKGEYQKSGQAGAVFSLAWEDQTRGVCGLFGIRTRNCKEGGEVPHVFGEVVDGMHVVTEAAQHRKIKEVTVVDCGVVL